MHEYVDGDALVREFMRWKSLENNVRCVSTYE